MSENNPSLAAYIGQGCYNAGVAYVYDLKKKTSRLIADPMKPTLERIELGEMKPWNFTASDGTEIKGMMCLPPSFDPNKKYPVIEYIYSGPGDAYTPKSFMPYNWYTTSLAELGFIVVQ